jgi:hypothetical protein
LLTELPARRNVSVSKEPVHDDSVDRLAHKRVGGCCKDDDDELDEEQEDDEDDEDDEEEEEDDTDEKEVEDVCRCRLSAVDGFAG